MPGRGPQTFKKRQKEQERKERAQEKLAKRLQRKSERGTLPNPAVEQEPLDRPLDPESPDHPFGS
jgi:hypothetical protein